MRPVYSLHNPFINRFNEPVTRRRDEMQCDEYIAWLRERNLTGSIQKIAQPGIVSNRFGRVFASVFGLLVLVISIAVFMRAL